MPGALNAQLLRTPVGRSAMDPITVAVIGGALSTIAEEIGKGDPRRLFDHVEERQDLLHGLFDPRKDARPRRAHTDPCRLDCWRRRARAGASSLSDLSGQAMPSSATIPIRGAERISTTLC